MDGAVQQMLEQNLLQVAQTMEAQLDAQLHNLDNLEEDDLERIRQKRIDDLKKMQVKKQEWIAKGHGELREVEEREFFKEMKGEKRMVCMFYRSSIPCDAMERHLTALAAAHLETKFVKVQAEKSPFLTERLKVWMLPTLAIIKDEKTTDYVVGLDELGGKEDFDPAVLEARLVGAGVIFEDAPARPAPGGQAAGAQRTMRKGGAPRKTESDEDSDFD